MSVPVCKTPPRASDPLERALIQAKATESMGRRDEARKLYREAARQFPKRPEPSHFLGLLDWNENLLDQAIQHFQDALIREPNFEPSLLGLIHTTFTSSRLDLLRPAMETLYDLRDHNKEYLLTLGRILVQLGELPKGKELLREYTEKFPDDALGWNYLGEAHADRMEYTQGEACQLKALERKPDFPIALNSLGSLYRNVGRLDEAAEHFARALKWIRPPLSVSVVHSNKVFMQVCQPNHAPEYVFQMHQEWAQRHAPQLEVPAHANTPLPHRALRIGYVSPDLRSHPVSIFLLPILRKHDREQFQVYTYSNSSTVDGITQQIQAQSIKFENIVGKTAAQVDELIRKDRIDILIDLAGHTADNRLDVFARHPAPVQITYLGYPHSSGLSQIDYRITDAEADPEGYEAHHSEQVVRMPDGFLCYEGLADAPEVNDAPALTEKQVVFGCFNHLIKINDAVLQCWGKILERVPNSKLLFKARPLTEDGVREKFLLRCEACGIPRERILLLPWETSVASHLSVYHRVDIALDPFPYNGTTTTCEALWMGVPMVTLAGNRHSARVGVSLLTRVGHPEWIAQTETEYIDKVVALAGDPQKLQSIRSKLRDEFKASPLSDAKGFTQRFEIKLRELWGNWCAKQNRTHSTLHPALPQTALAAAQQADQLLMQGQRTHAHHAAVTGLSLCKDLDLEAQYPALFEKWGAPNLGAMLARMAITTGPVSSCRDAETASRLLKMWLRMESNCPEPLLRLGLLSAWQAQQAKMPLAPIHLEMLKLAHHLFNQPRTRIAIELALKPDTTPSVAIPFDEGTFIAPGSLQNFATYVLLEQGDWYEDEIVPFRLLCQNALRVLEVGSGSGVYSFGAARRVADGGQVLSIEGDELALKGLKMNAEKFPHWQVLAAKGSSNNVYWKIDEGLDARNWSTLDLLKLDTGPRDLATLRSARKTLERSAPIVFYKHRQSGKTQPELTKLFKEWGYEAHVYRSGTRTWEVFDPSQPSDESLTNLAAAKPESKEKLFQAV